MVDGREEVSSTFPRFAVCSSSKVAESSSRFCDEPDSDADADAAGEETCGCGGAVAAKICTRIRPIESAKVAGRAELSGNDGISDADEN